jgi:1-aminocyclopropane-1-carboxylate deaminase/D-cysteine desulfhydrase-like pyridoxal-dependent ACC family enzyme
MKRDDLTGLATGGNKTRYLEFTLADALEKGADTLLLNVSIQSNHARQLSAAAARLGLEVHLLLVVRGVHGGKIQGNFLLEDLLGANITLMPLEQIGRREQILEEKAEKLRREGHTPYLMSNPRAGLLSGVAYVNAALELHAQLAQRDIKADYIWMASSGGTVAGYMVAGKALNTGWKAVAHAYHIVPVGKKEEARREIATNSGRVAEFLGIDLDFSPQEVTFYPQYVGEAFEAVAPWSGEAMRLVAQAEGIIIEPLYTGRAVASLREQIQQGNIGPGETVVLIHTGGIPNIFYYGEELTAQNWTYWED